LRRRRRRRILRHNRRRRGWGDRLRPLRHLHHDRTTNSAGDYQQSNLERLHGVSFLKLLRRGEYWFRFRIRTVKIN
jgi:hypothetical protein